MSTEEIKLIREYEAILSELQKLGGSAFAGTNGFIVNLKGFTKEARSVRELGSIMDGIKAGISYAKSLEDNQ